MMSTYVDPFAGPRLRGALATVAQGRRRIKAVIYSQAGGPEMLRVVERAHPAVRLFDNLGEPKPTLRQVQAVEVPGVTHIRYARGEDQ
jgi:hypothetical protein